MEGGRSEMVDSQIPDTGTSFAYTIANIKYNKYMIPY